MESRAPEGRQAAGGGSQSGAGWNPHVCDQTILAWWGRAWAGGGLTQPHLPCTPTPTHPPNSRQAPPEDSRPVRGLLNGGHHHKACVRAETSRPQSLQVGRALPPPSQSAKLVQMQRLGVTSCWRACRVVLYNPQGSRQPEPSDGQHEPAPCEGGGRLSHRGKFPSGVSLFCPHQHLLASQPHRNSAFGGGTGQSGISHNAAFVIPNSAVYEKKYCWLKPMGEAGSLPVLHLLSPGAGGPGPAGCRMRVGVPVWIVCRAFPGGFCSPVNRITGRLLCAGSG